MVYYSQAIRFWRLNKVRLLLGVEDMVDVKQLVTKGQKNEVSSTRRKSLKFSLAHSHFHSLTHRYLTRSLLIEVWPVREHSEIGFPSAVKHEREIASLCRRHYGDQERLVTSSPLSIVKQGLPLIQYSGTSRATPSLALILDQSWAGPTVNLCHPSQGQ